VLAWDEYTVGRAYNSLRISTTGFEKFH
jgi:hypothetical protein